MMHAHQFDARDRAGAEEMSDLASQLLAACREQLEADPHRPTGTSLRPSAISTAVMQILRASAREVGDAEGGGYAVDLVPVCAAVGSCLSLVAEPARTAVARGLLQTLMGNAFAQDIAKAAGSN